MKKEYPLHHSNVMHWSATKQVRSRVGYKVSEWGLEAHQGSCGAGNGVGCESMFAFVESRAVW